MDYTKVIVSNQKKESIIKQRVYERMLHTYLGHLGKHYVVGAHNGSVSVSQYLSVPNYMYKKQI